MKLLLGILALLLVAVAIVVIVPRLAPLETASFDSVRPLLAAAPPGATMVGVVPRYASFVSAVDGHAVAGGLWDDVVPPQASYLSWIVGNATVVMWTEGKSGRGLATDAGALRAFVLRVALARGGAAVNVVNGRTAIASGSSTEGGFSIDAPAPSDGHAFLAIPPDGERGFPPLDPPSITSIRLDPAAVITDSVSLRSGSEPVRFAPQVVIPSNAMLAVNAGDPPQLIRDLDRVLPDGAAEAMARGGQVVLYAIEPKTLFPVPRGVIVVPRAEGDVARRTDLAPGVAIEESIVGDRRVISFDERSLASYRAATFAPAENPADAVWVAEIRPRELVPALRKIENHRGMRLISKRTHRAVRNALRWLAPLQAAERVTAVRRTTAGEERLRIEIR